MSTFTMKMPAEDLIHHNLGISADDKEKLVVVVDADSTLDEALGLVRKRMILEQIKLNNGNKAAAARKLGICRTLVRFWTDRYELEGISIPRKTVTTGGRPKKQLD